MTKARTLTVALALEGFPVAAHCGCGGRLNWPGVAYVAEAGRPICPTCAAKLDGGIVGRAVEVGEQVADELTAMVGGVEARQQRRREALAKALRITIYYPPNERKPIPLPRQKAPARKGKAGRAA